jgi:hypothetical protein
MTRRRVVKVSRRRENEDDSRPPAVASDEARLYAPLRWPVHEYEIRLKPWGGVGAVFSSVGRPFPAAGVIAPKGWSGNLDELSASVSTYHHPLPSADEILQDISELPVAEPSPAGPVRRLADNDAVLRFVNKWGVLGVGVGTGPRRVALLDGVAETHHHLAWIQHTQRRIFLFQDGRPLSGDSWTELAWELNNSAIADIRPLAVPTKNGLGFQFQPRRLLDVLCLRLLEFGTGTEKLRQCKECSALFVPDRRDQIYCKTGGEQVCARRASLRAYRRRHARLTSARPGRRRSAQEARGRTAGSSSVRPAVESPPGDVATRLRRTRPPSR